MYRKAALEIIWNVLALKTVWLRRVRYSPSSMLSTIDSNVEALGIRKRGNVCCVKQRSAKCSLIYMPTLISAWILVFNKTCKISVQPLSQGLVLSKICTYQFSFRELTFIMTLHTADMKPAIKKNSLSSELRRIVPSVRKTLLLIPVLLLKILRTVSNKSRKLSKSSKWKWAQQSKISISWLPRSVR